MDAQNPRCVQVQKPEASFGVILNEMRSWLHHRKIEPAEFKCLPVEPGVVAFDIRFKNENEAELFERAFA